MAAFIAVGCSKDSLNDGDAQTVGTKFIVKMALTKAVLVEDGSNYDLKWADGDKICFKLSDDSLVEAPVSVSGATASVNIDLGGNTIVDAWFPSNGKVKPTAIPTTQSSTSVNIPLQKSSISGNKIYFEAIDDDWAIMRVAVKAGTKGTAKTINRVTLKDNKSANPFVMYLSSTALSTSDAALYDFVVPVVADSQYEVIVREDDTYGREYCRKKATTTTLTAHNVYTMNVTVDDTGLHRWIMGSGASNTDEAPLNYWYKLNASNAIDTDNMSQNTGYVTVTTHLNGTKYVGNFTPIFQKKYSSDGTTTSTERKVDFGAIYGSTIPFLAVHTGNFPIFAIKMTNPTTLGSSRNINLDTSSINPDSIFSSYTEYKGNVGGTNNKQNYYSGEVGGYTYSSSSDVAIIYYNLQSQSFATGGVAKNTQMMAFQTWQLKVADVVADSAPTYNVYWAGFFNNVDELAAFAAGH